MAIPHSIKQYLMDNGVSYAHKTHSVAFTSQQTAQVEHLPGREFAKSVVLQADGRMILAVLPGDQFINLDKLKLQLGSGKLCVASEREFIDTFPECEPGAMPPFGKLFGLRVYCDGDLAKQPEIEFNAGTHIDTIRMTYASFSKLEDPTMVSFSEKGESYRGTRVA